ncbi:MAG: nucleotidyltransferase family protein [Gemmatimonadaceae bacterium]|nr:nucleotidyltransferase family protein [Gemmatimonadaceae bacterium]
MPHTPSPSVAFVLAALNRAAASGVSVRDAAAAVDDWHAVERHAQHHDVVWWVAKALPDHGVPGDARARIAAAAHEQAIASLAGARQLVSLLALLENAGVRTAAYKGPALAVDAHGDVGARHFYDLDVFVAQRDRERASAALSAAGYAVPDGMTAREEQFYARWEGVAHREVADGLPVELHWRCQAARYGGPGDPAGVLERTRACALGGGHVPVPAVEDLGVLLALHGAKHAWRLLMWVADFSAVVSRTDFDWDRFAGRAAEWGVRRAARYGVLVGHDLTGILVPRRQLEEARGDAAAARLAAAIIARHRGDPAAADVGGDSEPRYDVQWLDGVRARMRYVTLAAALPTPRDRAAARLPDLLLPLAYPMRAWRLLRHAVGPRA